MRTFIFTFGSDGQIYEGGWIKVHAKDLDQAEKKFVAYYGKQARNENGLLRYAFAYTEQEFEKTGMAKGGNYGAFCRDEIV